MKGNICFHVTVISSISLGSVSIPLKMFLSVFTSGRVKVTGDMDTSLDFEVCQGHFTVFHTLFVRIRL